VADHYASFSEGMKKPNQGAAVNRRSAGQSGGSENLSAIVAADRAFPAAVAELGRTLITPPRRLPAAYPGYGMRDNRIVSPNLA
jgi:hypothetical protein